MNQVNYQKELENFKYLTGEGRGSAGLPAAPPVSA